MTQEKQKNQTKKNEGSQKRNVKPNPPSEKKANKPLPSSPEKNIDESWDLELWTDDQLKKALADQKEAIKKRIKLKNADSLHKSVILREIEAV